MVKHGILIQDETALCMVEPVIGYSIKVTHDGSISRDKQYASTKKYILGKTIMPRLKIIEPKSNLSNVKATDVYKIGMKCFLLDKKYYGDQAKILFFNQQKNIVKLRVEPALEPDLSEILEQEGQILDDNYLSNDNLARKLQLLPKHVARITGCIYVQKNNQTYKYNIALNLKFKEKRECILNHSIFFDGQWYFSNEVGYIISNYMNLFPTVTNLIFNYNYEEAIDYKQLFPVGDADQQFEELLEYLNSLPFKKERKISVDTRFLDQCLVKIIEDILQSSPMVLEKRKPVEISTNVSNIFYPLSIFGSKIHPDPNAVFNLYDRVVNIKQDIVVPQGLKGIVIGIEENYDTLGNPMITVCFDEVFEGGKKINTKDNRAYSLPQCYLMNISFGKIQMTKSNNSKFIYEPTRPNCHQKDQFFLPDQKIAVNPYYQNNNWINYDLNDPNLNNNYLVDTNYYYDYNYLNHHPNNYYVPNPFAYNQQQDYQYYDPNYNQQRYAVRNQNFASNYHQKSHQKRYQKNEPIDQSSTISSNQTGKYLNMWNNLLEDANTALKNKKPNPLENLTFNPTINLIKHPHSIASLSTTKNVAAERSSQNKEQQKTRRYYSELIELCDTHYKIKPEIICELDKKLVKIKLPLEDGPVTYGKEFKKKISEEDAIEQVCKIVLNRVSFKKIKSNVDPPTFVKQNQPETNQPPMPPKNWIE